MILCLVTDRRRLAGPPASFDDARRCLDMQARFAVDAGIDLVQVRERDLEAAMLASIVRDVLAVTRGTQTRLLVNDRLDVALACGADGVHLRADSIAAEQARRLAPPGFLISQSVHAVEDAWRVVDADFLIAGTMFSSASKPAGHPLLGVDGLHAIAAATTVPVLAIGGITVARVDDLARAGAAGCAAIGMFMDDGDADDPARCRAMPLRTIVNAARHRFDSVKTRP